MTADFAILYGTPEHLWQHIAKSEVAGLSLLPIQMSPRAAEMERSATPVMGTVVAREPLLA